MSYILDALRKSEAERHQEKMPGYVQQGPMLNISSDRRSPWLIAFAVLVMLNLVFISVFLLMKQEQDVDVKANTEITNQASEGRPSQVLTPENLNNDGRGLSSNQGGRSDGRYRQRFQDDRTYAQEQDYYFQEDQGLPPAYDLSPDQYPDSPSEYGWNPDYGTSQVVDPLDQEVLITPQGTAGVNVDMPVDSYSQDYSSDSEEIVIRPKSGVVRKFPQQDEAPEVDEEAFISIMDMPERFRLQVPPLVFNSHIFTTEPEGRRIMINNNYLREGQKIVGMKIHQITEDGVVFDWRGERFQIPVVRNWNPTR